MKTEATSASQLMHLVRWYFTLTLKFLKYYNYNGNHSYWDYKVQHHSIKDWQQIMLCRINNEIGSICKVVP